MKKNMILAAVAALFLTPISANAQESQDYLSFSVGYYDILDDHEAVDFRAEYRPGHNYFWYLKPWAGVEVTSDFSLWAGGGILADIPVAPQWYVTPSVGAGYYAKGSSKKDLDYPLEFRSQLEVAYQLDTGSRIGAAFGHLSNASLGDRNPGTEVLSLYWHLPY